MKGIHVFKRNVFHSRHFFNKASPQVQSIIRVDHAGELGADRIYAGQMAVLGNSKSGPIIKEMWEQEKRHKTKFEELIVRHRVRPTMMTPIWNIAGFALGAGTALLGEKAAMACTVAVETVIVDHYNDQLRELMAQPNPNPELLETIKQFRDEEQEHHDTGLTQGAEQAPLYQALTSSIKLLCRTAIMISKGCLGQSKNVLFIQNRHYCTTTTVSEETKRRWDLVSAVFVERKPVVLEKLTDFETKYMGLMSELEVINSHKSNHEIRHEADLEAAQKKTADIEMDSVIKQTAQDFEDASAQELEQFVKAPIVTRADQTNDHKTVQRKLDSHLCLLTQIQLGSKPTWLLPQAIWTDGETLRQTAERALKETCGSKLCVTLLGNAPFGFYKYKYPKVLRATSSEGAKIFFFKALYRGGDVILDGATADDYQWVTRKEMEELLSSEDYLKSIQMFMIDDNKD